jgi:ATP-dependent Lon protease
MTTRTPLLDGLTALDAPVEAGAVAESAAPERRVTDAIPMPSTLPVLPIRNAVLFPGTVVPLTVSRPSSLKLLADLPSERPLIGVFTQKQAHIEHPAPEDLFTLGVVAAVVRTVKQEDDSIVAIVHGLERIVLRQPVAVTPYLKAEVEPAPSVPLSATTGHEAAVNSLRETALQLLSLKTNVPDQVGTFVKSIEDASRLTDFIASGLDIDADEKQAVLEMVDVGRRIRAVQRHISRQLQIAQLQVKIQRDVASEFTDAQRRAYLQEQLRVIHKELGEDDESVDEVTRLREKLVKASPPETVRHQAERELRRLRTIPSASAEHAVVINYLETLSDLPWSALTEDNLDLDHAQRVLDRDHHGLEKVKRRLIEFLAVRKLNPKNQGPILCLVGPPGVGKTSLGHSVARALGRKFARVSLGGARDEADIRGHRRTYIGAMPGRIIDELRRAGTRNPVILLDELDKLGADFRGDPSSALLEVLDPAQNRNFVDHFIDAPFDLSQVLFIATANDLSRVPHALRDRLEVIELHSYTDREKRAIATRYLIPRQRREHGLSASQFRIAPPALQRIISDYTREAGVRELERQIAALCRHAAARIARSASTQVRVTPSMVARVLGPARYLHDEKLDTPRPGVVTGLAWTPVGGEILHIEALKYPGKGEVQLTGQLGDVMRESVKAAISLVRSRARKLGINPSAFKTSDVHIHVPAGAVPKDGPSAGVAMFTALASLYADKPVRTDLAMTGEITLRGLVLPIGGLKEKALAAIRAGIPTVLIPAKNLKDLAEIPAEARAKLRFITVETVDDVIREALRVTTRPPSRRVPESHCPDHRIAARSS